MDQGSLSSNCVATEDCVGFEPPEATQTAAPEGVALSRMGWLGVRDDFRNWLIRAA
jgi:hypothetical protein